MLTAKDGNGTIKWYDDPLGGTQVAVGDTFFTPLLSETKIYYVARVLPGSPDTVQGAKPDTSGGGEYYPWDDEAAVRGLIFDVHKPIILRSVKVYNDTGQAATRTISVVNFEGNIIATKEVFIPEGESRIKLNFPINPGESYFLKAADPHKGLYRNGSGVSFPYYIGDAVTITASDVGTEYYYFFYDWEIVVSGDSVSCRSAVRAVITPSPRATFRYQVYDTAVYFTNNSSGDNYLWDFGDGTTIDEKDPIHSYQGYDTYTVSLVLSNSCGTDTTTERIIVEKSSQTAVPLFKEEVAFTCYPNPTRNEISFRSGIKTGVKATVLIYNSSGNIVRTQKVNDLSLFHVSVSMLPSGIYFLKTSVTDLNIQPVRFIILK
jgi:PKD repeat protein